MDMVKRLNSFVSNISHNESVKGEIAKVIENQKKPSTIPKNYYFLTELVNPAQAFWSRKRRDIHKSDELARKLALGKSLERVASKWFRNIKGYSVEEGKIDGVWVGVPGVRGSIDYKIGNATIEFKTKEKIPESENEILELYPHDLEQLLFYAALDPSKPKTGIIVFMEDSRPHKLKAFRAEIRELGRLKTLLVTRIKLLTKAIESDNPAELGRCRYYNKKCQFGENKVCSCESLDPLSIEQIKKSVNLVFDAGFTELLEREKENAKSPSTVYKTGHVLTPRKYYMEIKLGLKDTWEPTGLMEEYNACIYNTMKKLPFSAKKGDREMLGKSLREDRLQIAYQWLNLKSSMQPDGEWVPYIAKASRARQIANVRNPSAYQVAKLAIACAAYNKTKGIIVIIYPYLDDMVQVFEVEFKQPKEILNIIKEQLDLLDKAIKEKDLFFLTPCPEFRNNNGSCPLMKDCNAKGVEGCKS